MLLQLSVQNFALIDATTIEFHPGLNVLTGETGAGKSILLDALRILLGERVDSAEVRVKGEPAFVEGVFTLGARQGPFWEKISGFVRDGDDLVILKRELTPEGRTKNSINGSLVNLSLLKEAGRLLADFHGQHDSQRIFSRDTHLELLDRFAALDGPDAFESLMESYREGYVRYRELLKRQDELTRAALGKQRELDLLEYQIREIEKVSPREGEEEELKTEKIRLAHAQKLSDLSGRVLDFLNDVDPSASGRIQESFRDLAAWARIDPSAEDYGRDLGLVQSGLEELIRRIQDYRASLSSEPARLGWVEERLDGIETLKRKYGSTLAEVLCFFEEARKRYDDLTNAETYQKDAEREMASLLPALEEKAGAIRAARRQAARGLVRGVENELKELGMRHARFDCRLTPCEYSPRGADQAEYLFSANAGEELKPLSDIASAGEASRFLLALKRVLAAADDIPTLIFDEIDANIGGRLGDVVGRKVREMAAERQVLLITHLPQIASFADCHVKAEKAVIKGRTVTRYRRLGEPEKVNELAQMMSGEKETEISRKHAREMLKTAAR